MFADFDRLIINAIHEYQDRDQEGLKFLNVNQLISQDAWMI